MTTLPVLLRLWRLCGWAALSAALCPLAVAGSAANCSSDKAPTVHFETDIQPLLNERCVMCHLTGAANAELNLEPGLAYKNLVGVASTQSTLLRVKPGASQESYLVRKLSGTHIEAGGTGAQMPFDSPPLEPKQIALIVAWIKACAPDN